jgi:hypothetical protein
MISSVDKSDVAVGIDLVGVGLVLALSSVAREWLAGAWRSSSGTTNADSPDGLDPEHSHRKSLGGCSRC